MTSLPRGGLGMKVLLLSSLFWVYYFTVGTDVATADDVLHKLGRGVVNTITSPLELPVSIAKESQSHGSLYGFVRGCLIGPVRTGARLLAGATEMATCWVPPYDEPYYPMKLGTSPDFGLSRIDRIRKTK
jgi:putative exosortase-associated protein (TIGR04073 family)